MTNPPIHPDLQPEPRAVNPSREKDIRNFALGISLLAVVLAFNAANGARRDFPQLEGYSGVAQTWHAEYQWTTCAEYAEQMTDQQRQVAASDILKVAWMRLEDYRETPDPGQAAIFTTRIQNACLEAAGDSTADALSRIGLIDAASLAYYRTPVKP